jgi:hypothetical protein
MDAEEIIERCKQSIDSGEPQTNYMFYCGVLNLLRKHSQCEDCQEFNCDDCRYKKITL